MHRNCSGGIVTGYKLEAANIDATIVHIISQLFEMSRDLDTEKQKVKELIDKRKQFAAKRKINRRKVSVLYLTGQKTLISERNPAAKSSVEGRKKSKVAKKVGQPVVEHNLEMPALYISICLLSSLDILGHFEPLP